MAVNVLNRLPMRFSAGFLQRTLCGEISAHAVYSYSRWGRGRADVHTFCRSGVKTASGPREELPQIHYPGGDVAAHQVGIAAFNLGWGHHMIRQHTVAKTRREAFDLKSDPLPHVECRAIGHVAV